MSSIALSLPRGGRNPLAAATALVLASALLLAIALPAHAATWIVDNSTPCPATPDGSALAPYCTIQSAANAHHLAGDTILVKAGTYREQVTVPASSGVAGAPYVFQADGPGVLVDGSDVFADAALWTLSSGTTYLAASVTWSPRQVFVDGARLAASTSTPDALPANSFVYVAGAGLYVNLGGDNPGIHQTLVGHRNFGFNMFNRTFVNISGFAVSHTEDRGINIQNGCTDLVISHNTISFTRSYGIQSVNGQRITIDGNTVSYANFHGIGLINGASGCIVSNNESFGNFDPAQRQANGIFLGGAPGNTLFGNRLHDNQDTGEQFSGGSNDCISYNNLSYHNGDHGYDHLGSSGVQHINDEAYNNFLDGFSFEGNAPGGQVFNCISVENNEFDLWVDGTSTTGFASDYNIFWNSGAQAPVKYVSTQYTALSDFQVATGLDTNSIQADPRFVSPATGDFRLTEGSPAIDHANSGVANWPATDALGGARVDDPRVANTGAGPVAFSDLGALEFVPVDAAPIVIAPSNVISVSGSTVTFTVTATDPDGDPITSLVLLPVKLPANSGATFTTNADHTVGTFTWTVNVTSGTQRVGFVAANSLADTAYTNIQVRKKARLTAQDQPAGDLPGVIALSSGYPNPSRDVVDFSLSLPSDSQVDLSVFDMQGRRVFSDVRSFGAGHVRLRWDGMSSGRRPVGAGLYLVRVRAGDSEFLRRIVRL